MRIAYRRRHVLRIAVAILALGGLWRRGLAQDQPNFDRWEKAIAAFEKEDRENPPPKNGVLFAGGSSIRLWNLKKWFPELDAINRGFGGSQIIDSVHFAPRIILKHQPRTVVLFAGDNDLNAGKTPEQVRDDFRSFVRAVHKELPGTKIIFIGVKPSPARWKLADRQRQANAMIQADCEADDRLRFIDTFKPMLGPDGQPRGELFVKDRLHMNDKGYEIWTSLLAPVLK